MKARVRSLIKGLAPPLLVELVRQGGGDASLGKASIHIYEMSPRIAPATIRASGFAKWRSRSPSSLPRSRAAANLGCDMRPSPPLRRWPDRSPATCGSSILAAVQALASFTSWDAAARNQTRVSHRRTAWDVRGREAKFVDDARINFHTALADTPASTDIVYCQRALQYIEDYLGQLRALASLGAPWLLLARTPTGDIPTFATRQLNLPGQILPYWFINRAEFVDLLDGHGYRLIWESVCDHEYDQSNFPVTHRIGRMRTSSFYERIICDRVACGDIRSN